MNNLFFETISLNMVEGARVVDATPGLCPGGQRPQTLAAFFANPVPQLEGPVAGQPLEVTLADGRQAAALSFDGADSRRVIYLIPHETRPFDSCGSLRWRREDGSALAMDASALAMFGLTAPPKRLDDLLLTRIHSDDYMAASRYFQGQGSREPWHFRVVSDAGIRFLLAEVCLGDTDALCRLLDITGAVAKGRDDLTELMPALFITYSGPRRMLTYANARARAALGVEPGSLTRVALSGLIHEADLPRLESAERHCQETGRQAQEELRLDLGQGQVLWLQASVHNPAQPGGEPHFMMIASDINRLKNAESRLAESHRQLKTVTDNVDCGIGKISIENGDMRLLYANDTYYRIMEQTPPQSEGPVFIDGLLHPDDRQTLLDAHRQQRGDFSLELRFRRGTGYFWVTASARKMVDLAGRPYYLFTFQDVDHLKRVEQELLLSNSRYRLLLSNTGDTYYEIDLREDALYRTVGDSARGGRELVCRGLPGSIARGTLLVDADRQDLATLYGRLKAGSPRESWSGRIQRQNGHVMWAQITFFCIRDSRGNAVQAMGMLKDVTREKEMALRFEGEEKYMAVMVDSSLLVTAFSLSTQRVHALYQEGLEVPMTADSPAYDTLLKTMVFQLAHPDDRPAVLEFYSARRIAVEYSSRGVQGECLDYRVRHTGSADGWLWVRGSLNVLPEPQSGEPVCFAYIIDIDMAKRQELELKHKAESDGLTGLLNRVTVKSKVDHFLKHEAGQNGLHALIMLDLDGFKQVNDTYGHKVGDLVLRQLADRMRNTSRTSDYLSRLGGDEFVIFMKNADDPEIVIQKARKICNICCALQVPGSDSAILSASVGIAMAPMSGADFDTLYEKADKAMYTAKRNGKNRIATYSETLGDGEAVDPEALGGQSAQLIDRLTGYGSFDKFRMDALERLHARRPQERLAVCYFDIKNFKYINDVFGYAEGNRLLQKLADYLAAESGEGETFARLAGDVFVVLRRYGSRSELTDRFQRIVDFLHQIKLEGARPHRIECCTGIYCVESDDDRLPIEEMVDRANLAEKSVKQVPGSNMVFYVETMREQMIREKEIEQAMYQALRSEEFQVYFQPKIDINRDNRVAGAEALVRWHKPEGEILMPSEFIPVFERNGFITQLDEYVLACICKLLRRQIDGGHRYVPVSVNVSRMALFSPNFVERYTAIKEQYSIPNGLIELEFTENLVFENHVLFGEVVARLKEAGFLCSLDNFGAGNSSLNLLRDLPIDNLKMDRLFFKQGRSTRQNAIISSVVAMAQALDMNIVTEGVEEMDQVEFLRGLGCDYVQGYVYSKAVPMEELMGQVDRIG